MNETIQQDRCTQIKKTNWTFKKYIKKLVYIYSAGDIMKRIQGIAMNRNIKQIY